MVDRDNPCLQQRFQPEWSALQSSPSCTFEAFKAAECCHCVLKSVFIREGIPFIVAYIFIFSMNKINFLTSEGNRLSSLCFSVWLMLSTRNIENARCSGNNSNNSDIRPRTISTQHLPTPASNRSFQTKSGWRGKLNKGCTLLLMKEREKKNVLMLLSKMTRPHFKHSVDRIKSMSIVSPQLSTWRRLSD